MDKPASGKTCRFLIYNYLVVFENNLDNYQNLVTLPKKPWEETLQYH